MIFYYSIIDAPWQEEWTSVRVALLQTAVLQDSNSAKEV